MTFLLQNKEWYLLINNAELGPFSLKQLRQHPDFNPDTLVKREGDKKWIEARYVEELQDLFKDEEEKVNQKVKLTPPLEGEELAIYNPIDPWKFLIIALLLVLATYFAIYLWLL